MKKLLLLVFLQSIIGAVHSQGNILSADVQIKLAVLAAPEDKRDGAAVYGYAPDKSFTLLRKGTNELVCLADDPNQNGYSSACYHKDLEPFMHRGRELKKMGKTSDEIFKMREQEVKDGKLMMPKQPSTLFVYSASKNDYDEGGGTVKNGYVRSVIYIPFATAESTGLPLKPPAPGLPWIMHPGTHGAHIMISPPVVKDAMK